MGVWWMLATLILAFTTVQSQSEHSTKLQDKSISSLTLSNRIDRLERGLANLNDQVSMNKIKNLRNIISVNMTKQN